MTTILPALRVPDKATLLRELARLAAPSLDVDAAILARLLAEREQLGSTGIGNGVAMPHARLASLATPTAFFTRLARPIAYDAIDGAPVDLVHLLVSPVDDNGTHLATLAAAARRLRDPALRATLRAADRAERMAEVLG